MKWLQTLHCGHYSKSSFRETIGLKWEFGILPSAETIYALNAYVKTFLGTLGNFFDRDDHPASARLYSLPDHLEMIDLRIIIENLRMR